MKLVLITDSETVTRFLDNGEIKDYSCVPLSEESKEIMKEFVEMNTGFEGALVTGVCSINGVEGLENIYQDIPSFLDIREGLFALEFDVDDDLAASIPYGADFDSCEDIESLTKEVSSMNIFLAPILTMDYFVDYRYVNANWELEKPNKPIEQMIKVDF